MSSNQGFVVTMGVDLSEFDAALVDVENRTDNVDKAVKKVVKRSYQQIANVARMTLYAVQAITGVIDQVLFSMVEAAVLAYEAIISISVATAGIIPWRAGFQLITAAAILMQARNIALGRTEIAARSAASVQTLRTASMLVGS